MMKLAFCLTALWPITGRIRGGTRKGLGPNGVGSKNNNCFLIQLFIINVGFEFRNYTSQVQRVSYRKIG